MDELVWEFTSNEIESALKKLRHTEKNYGFFTVALMKEIIGEYLAYCIIHRGYTRVVETLADPELSHLQLTAKGKELSYTKNTDIFHGVYGVSSVIARITRILKSRRGRKVLLYGAPGTGKSLIMERLREIKTIPVLYISADSKASSFFGIQKLIKEKYEEVGDSNFIVCVDEIDKTYRKGADNPFSEQEKFLGMFDSEASAKIINQKGSRSGEVESTVINLPSLKVFATANDITKVYPYLLNRFITFAFTEYTEKSFIDVGMDILTKDRHIARALAYEMANYEWHHRRNIRNLDQYADLYDSIEDFKAGVSEEERKGSQVMRETKEYS